MILKESPFSGGRWLFALVLAGCAGGGGQGGGLQYHMALHAAPDEAVFVGQALDSTVQAFIGPGSAAPAAGASGTGPGFILGGITGDTLSPDSTTPHRLDQSLRGYATAEAQFPLGHRLHATQRLALGQGHSRYALPEGSGILADPITINFATRFVAVETGVVWDAALAPHLGMELGVGVGVRMTQTTTRITSALLDVHNISHQQDAFVALRAGVWAQKDQQSVGRIQLDLEALAYPGKMATLGLGLSTRY